MKVQFPFLIKQVSDTEVEVILNGNTPILEMVINPTIAQEISDEEHDKIYEAALIQIVKSTIKVY